MGVCDYCKKTYFLFDPIVKCKILSCNRWAHKSCASKRVKDVKKWLCEDHGRTEDRNVSMQSEIGNFTINPEQEQHSIPLFSYENALLSSSPKPIDNRTKNTNNIPVNNEIQPSTSTGIGLNPLNNAKICATCKLVIKDHYLTCKACNNYQHQPCLSRDEDGTVDSVNHTYVCNTCIDLIKKLRNSTNTPVNNISNSNCQNAENNQHQNPIGNSRSSQNPAGNNLMPQTTSSNNQSRQNRTSNYHMPQNHNGNNQMTLNASNNMANSNLYQNYRNPLPYNDEDSDNDSDIEEITRPFPLAPPRISLRHNNVNNASNNTTITSENFFFKLQMEKLPEVVDSDMSWNVFYSTFTETKQFFTASENVRRIQKAIKDETVKRIGGKGLYNLLTYDKCIEDINKRLKHNLSFLSTEASEIEHFSKIKNENKVMLVEFIDKLRNFCTISEAYNDFSYMNNRRFLATICDIIPYNLRNKWEERQARLENSNSIPSLKHMVSLFDKELPRIEASIRNDKLNATEKEAEKKSFKPKERNNRSYSTGFSNKSSSSISVGKYESQNDKYKCWFHKNNDHFSNTCKELWALNGKEVASLARENNICTYCGHDNHNPCPNSAKLKCRVSGCTFSHHSLFCYKRMSTHSKNSHNNNNIVNKSPDFKVRSKGKVSTDNNKQSEKTKNASDGNESSDESLFNRLQSHSYYTNLPSDLQTYLKSFQGKQSAHNVGILEKIENRINNTANDNCILGVLVVKLENHANYAFLLDSGSSVSLIEEDVANNLKLKGPWLPLRLVWSGDKKRYDNMSRVIKVKTSNIAYANNEHQLFFRTVKNLKVCPQKFVAKQIYHQHPKFRPLRLFDHFELSGIIGIDNIFAFEQYECIKSVSQNKYEFYGVRSPLGDYVHGTNMPMNKIFQELNGNKHVSSEKKCYSHVAMSDNEQDILKDMERESMGLGYDMPSENDRISYEEEYVINLLNENVKKDPNDNHYIAPLLWKEQVHNLPTLESFKLSYVRYLIMEKQSIALGRFDECVSQIQNLLDKKYASEMSYNEYSKPHDKAYYNPVFFIHPKGKRTRLIWDLAAKVKDKSLNDYMMSGPNLYNNLMELILKLREHKYLIKSDIKEMFHQIKVDNDDTNALRFLFRFDPNDKIKVFKLNVLPFGAACSPVISQYVKDKVADECKENYPLACHMIQKSCYVDDIVTSVEDKNEAINLVVDIKRILCNGGFNLLKINSNSCDIIEGIKQKLDDKELADENVVSIEMSEKILGYDINFSTDEISVASCLNKIPPEILECIKKPTKKQVLQILMTVFDPIGFIQFFTSKLKLIYHRMCKNSMSWDDEIDEENFLSWKKCMEWIKVIDQIKIPRVYCNHNAEVHKIQCWAFGDASADIMCGTIYARFLNKNLEQINVSLIYAKTFVVPYKQKRTIPELELSAALNISKMTETVKTCHTLKFDEFFYATDNQAVKEWIVNGVKKPTIYVKNRISKINNLTDKKCWYWIPTNLMPADFGTKESVMPQMTYKNKWFSPEIFCLPERDWTFIESNRVNAHDIAGIESNILDPKMFSKLSYLISTGQLALKWLDLIKLKKIKREILNLELDCKKDPHNREFRDELKNLKVQHMEKLNDVDNNAYNYVNVETIAIKNAQYDMFEKEIEMIKSNKKLPHSSTIYKLSPFLDENGILRVTSRLSYNEKNLKIYGHDRIYPILLPKDHALTKLIVMKYHESNFHMLTNTVITNLLKRFYIPHIKWTVTSIIKQNCYVCRRTNCKPDTPMMSDLPSHRLAFCVKPFTYCIADLAGPILTKNYRGRDVKRYIFVYSCLTTRAVHLELIEDLSSDSTLLALQNTMNIRGAPKCIITDNGSNFVGAYNIMQKAHLEWSKKLLEKGIIIDPIEWKFPPAKAPHMQGSIERIVGLVKTAISKMTSTLNKSHVKYNDFQLKAILYEIVGLLNNRPLAMTPMTKLNGEFLTPNHFLLGRQNIQSVPSCENVKEVDIYEHWEDIKLLSSILWKHWLSAYIPTIMMREKWINKCDPLKIDDIVIVADPTIANSWRIGKVIEIKTGSQQQVRSVTIKLGKNKPLDLKSKKSNKSAIIDAYKNESFTIISRPATAVAKIKLD